jgi:hypothetical protein
LLMRHSNVAGIPYTAWIDDVFVGAPNSSYFGTGCAGSGGVVPVLGVLGPSSVGSTTYALTANDAFSPSIAFFLMDITNTSTGGLSLPYALGGGCAVRVGVSVLLAVGVTGSGAGTGIATQNLPVPANPGLAGVVLYAQWVVSDPAAPNALHFATTAGYRFRIQ